ncbi:MAG: DUF1543 domain-containing protein [Candidatus Moraniibacteriota bacterium]
METQKFLFAVLLGKSGDGEELMEVHRLEFVVAESEDDAKVLAKTRWNVESSHIDGIRKLDLVDGYEIALDKKS